MMKIPLLEVGTCWEDSLPAKEVGCLVAILSTDGLGLISFSRSRSTGS